MSDPPDETTIQDAPPAVCDVCGEPGDDVKGVLIDHPGHDKYGHLSCLVAVEARENEKGLRARLEAAEKKVAEERAKKEEPKKEEPQARQCHSIKIEAENRRKKIEQLEDELEEYDKELDECIAEATAEKEEVQKLKRTPLIQYRSRSNLQVFAPPLGGGFVVLLLLLLFGFFEETPIAEPEKVVEYVEVPVPAEFPDVRFTFNRSKTDSADLIRQMLSDWKGQFHHDQIPILEEALENDELIITYKVTPEGKIVRTDVERSDP